MYCYVDSVGNVRFESLYVKTDISLTLRLHDCEDDGSGKADWLSLNYFDNCTLVVVTVSMTTTLEHTAMKIKLAGSHRTITSTKRDNNMA